MLNFFLCNKKTVQIMVPCNLRRLFPSQTLRNFSLYALPHIKPEDSDRPFEDLVTLIDTQLQNQITQEYMAASMAANTKAASFPLLKNMPLPLKHLILRLGHLLFGENNSCISLSNLGVITLPEEIQPYVTAIDFTLTPRMKSPYNCGIVTYDGVMAICFSRLSEESEVDNIFFEKLKMTE